ncbi:hypothetical protein [Methylomicrobium lacus]|uniref:hypothetical protein n=1 Tax=Methylomicrobium lacus TaxID=136992 RepID=UPI0035A8628F
MSFDTPLFAKFDLGSGFAKGMPGKLQGIMWYLVEDRTKTAGFGANLKQMIEPPNRLQAIPPSRGVQGLAMAWKVLEIIVSTMDGVAEQSPAQPR